jgi:DNA polymerase III epsilon subunit-like protein
MSKKQICIDLETGGFDPNEVSSLTVGLVVHEMRSGKVFDKLYLEIKESDGIYRVTAGALKVNKLDLVKHDAKALEPEEAVGQIIDFLKKNFKNELPATVSGQNTPFDIGFMKVLFQKADADYNDFFHYSYLDTMTILRFLAALDIIPPQACRLDGAAKHFGIPLGKGAHNALKDAEATVALFAKLAELFDGTGDVEEEIEEEEEKEAKASPKKRGRPAKKDKKNKKVKEDIVNETDETDEADEDDWGLDEDDWGLDEDDWGLDEDDDQEEDEKNVPEALEENIEETESEDEDELEDD